MKQINLTTIFKNEDKYKPTYDFQLDTFLKQRDGTNGFKHIGVLMKDDLSKLPKLPARCFCIVNYDNRHQDGSHWVAVVKDGSKAYHFGSYGIPPIQEIIDTFKRKGGSRLFFNDTPIQKSGTNICGHLCLYFIDALVAKQQTFRSVLDKMEALSNRQR